ncbi:helix-turn-helix domain-containing protein [Streptomyces arboris]|uniref:Helix-turn-helix domain-containing protein n=1 Tax=Streptomyces arboris TaxID=2600619 RepID=A0A5N5EEU1_9ACTN|nr:helix-turn-helix domain-containing protein [Streptomyces arboris]KAB2588181.1 helix-turn-helix domain-containing protein [Streptomyces arboris]
MDETPWHPLTAAREAAGLSREQLADRVRAAAARRGLRSGVDKSRVTKWETKGVRPDDQHQVYIAEALGLPAPAPGGPLPWPYWLPGAGQPLLPENIVALGPATTVPALREAFQATMDHTRRRIVVSAVSSTALLTLAGTWAQPSHTAAAQPEPSDTATLFDGEEIDRLEQATALFTNRATEDRMRTIGVLEALLQSVTDLLDERRHGAQGTARLHVLAAKLASEVGWHRFDLNRHAEAARFWIGGLHSTHELGDIDAGAGLLSDLAYQASWRSRPNTAADLLRRALSRARHPVAQSLLQLRLARALAVLGDRQGTLRALAAADKLLSMPAADPAPSFCSWHSTADLAVDTGQALLDLGDTRTAHHLIREGQAKLPAARIKTYGVFTAYRARSYLQLREPEKAAAAATEALDLALRIGAPRCVTLVRDLTPAFEAFPTAQGVPELLARTAA